MARKTRRIREWTSREEAIQTMNELSDRLRNIAEGMEIKCDTFGRRLGSVFTTEDARMIRVRIAHILSRLNLPKVY